ncbi:hypothetical protein N0V86_006787 [Didymella sp. IMI 355093]|nr:hypothetical protein N0V86_006787 [Didymella sp. IMI 355093]
MPSHDFANPPSQIAQFASSPTQRHKENIALPILQEVEISYETECLLDFQGRRHLDREASDQQYYFGQPEDASPSFPDFPMPGQASVDTLRNFLRRQLQPAQIVDEYGNMCDISAISNDHLPVLQAKFENTRNHTCDYMSDLQTTTEHTCQSRIIRIESLVHWGTITPEESLQYILPFHRDGELMRNKDKPEVKLYVRRLFDPKAPSYCVDCLGYLWSKCGEARGTIRQLQDSVPQPQHQFLEDTPVPRPVLKRKCPGSRSTDADTLAVGEAMDTGAFHLGSSADKLQEAFEEVLPQLDGACDRLDVTKQTKETKKRKNAPAGEQTVKLKKARKIATKISMPLAGMETAPKQFVPSKPQLGLSSPARLQRTTQPAPAVRSFSPPKLIVHFAKRSADSQLPDDIAEEEWEAFQSARPTPASKICFCDRPACHGKFKKGENPQIAQWGTLLCSVCRVKRECAEQDENSGWSVEKLMEYQPVWTKKRIETHIPGLGGVIPQTNPYGLGLEVQLASEYQHQINETGTLGGLQKLGCPQPQPEMLEEAYLHTGAYAELLARRAEEEQDSEWEDETHTDVEEDHDAEVYDKEMKEDL